MFVRPTSTHHLNKYVAVATTISVVPHFHNMFGQRSGTSQCLESALPSDCVSCAYFCRTKYSKSVLTRVSLPGMPSHLVCEIRFVELHNYFPSRLAQVVFELRFEIKIKGNMGTLNAQ